MGKGKGKGGCGLLEGIGDCIQCVAGTICCLCVSGPVLIIVGIAFIASAFSDGRGDRIDEFNMAVNNWSNGAVDNFNALPDTAWTYNAAAQPANCAPAIRGTLTRSTEGETARDPLALGSETGEGDFTGYEPLVFTDANPPSLGQVSQQTAECNLQYNLFFQGNSIGTFSVPRVEVERRSFQEFCITRNESNNRRNNRQFQERQDIQECSQRCQSGQFQGEASGQTYQTFQCVIRRPTSAVCVRVAPAGNGWAIADGQLPEMPEGARGSGCFIPINVANLAASTGQQWQTYETTTLGSDGASNIDVTVRHERDPYLYFLDISKGLRDFGLKRTEKLQIGFTCLGLGLLLTALICSCCFMIVKFARGFASGKKPPRPANPVGGALYDVSAKYGNFIPGGTALGQPVPPGQGPGANYEAQGVPAGGKPGATTYGAGTTEPYGTTAPAYGGNTSYDSAPPAGYPGGTAGGAPPAYGGAPPAYGGNTYGARTDTAGGGAPPPGYPTV